MDQRIGPKSYRQSGNTLGDSFQQLKARLVQAGRIYEDREFPAGPVALGRSGKLAANKHIVWKRPQEIVQNPQFIVGNASRLDLNQGAISDCWVIAATACLASYSTSLLRRVVPSDQEFDNKYAGIFRFNFWHYDTWTEVLIDDKLPFDETEGHLLFARNDSQRNEFWVPLLEKAYAKLYGGYDNLEFGLSNNALVDFTGGISEFIDIRPLRDSGGRQPDIMATYSGGQPSRDLYDRLYDMMKKSSMIGCHIAGGRIPEKPLPNGLYMGHAYSITNLVKLNVRGNIMRLLRIRNPWGKGEWRGPWCDRSDEWKSVPEKVRVEAEMTVNDDGEFWMAFEDWFQNFEFLTLCHLHPDSVTEEIENQRHKRKGLWEVQKNHSAWVRGFSAGGCGSPPNEALFWNNPQFGVTVGSSSSSRRSHEGDEERCHMVVSLMQESQDLKFPLDISLFLYKLKEGFELLNGQNYSRKALQLEKSAPKFTGIREVTVYYDVTPGNYVIIPCTFKPNMEGNFLLRTYTETQAQLEELDVQTSMSPLMAIQDDVVPVFKKWSGGDDSLDAKELVYCLNQLLNSEGFTSFDIETCRCMVAMYDTDKSGLLSLQEFKKLLAELRLWKDKFVAFDVDRSGNIDTYELCNLYQSIGFSVSRLVQKAIIQRYGGKKNRLTLDDFLHCTCKLVTLFAEFARISKSGVAGTAQMNLDEWLATTIYF